MKKTTMVIDVEDFNHILDLLDAVDQKAQRTTTGNLPHSIANIRNSVINWRLLLIEKYTK